jgi:Family of unknown function (DUF6247)
MTTQPQIQRTFTAVRAALPTMNAAAFDAELMAIIQAPALDLAALDDCLTGWWRITERVTRDREDWQRMHEEAERIRTGQRPAGPALSSVLARRRVSP